MAILVCKEYLKKLENHVLQNDFGSQQEEIYFFKEIKPKFYSKLLYYHKLFNIEVARPVGAVSDQKNYLQKEIDRIREYFEDNKFFYQYFRSGETYFDEKLFLRHKEDTPLTFQLYDVNSNPAFTTNYDYIISRILANELLLDHLVKSLSEIDQNQPVPSKESKPVKQLTWTEAKSSLIELIYAFKAKGSFNNGNVTIKEITDVLQEAFNVQITNPSRDFQDILSRKRSPVVYLNGLTHAYLKYIENIDEK